MISEGWNQLRIKGEEPGFPDAETAVVTMHHASPLNIASLRHILTCNPLTWV